MKEEEKQNLGRREVPLASAEPVPVSVVIPVFNRAALVRRAIDSVLAQDTTGYELIVVDDGSTDETPQVLAAYGGAIRVVRQENQGVSAARNRGVAASGGALIAFLDSDDRWLPGKLSRQAAYMVAHPEVQICQGEEIWIRNGVRVNPGQRHRKPSGWIFEPSLALCLVSPSAVMMTRGLWDEMGGFDTSLPACEDYDLWLRVSLRYPVHLLPGAFIEKYGGHPDQLSRMPALDRYRIQAICKVLDGAVLTAGQRAAALAMLERKCAVYAAGCRKRARFDEADRIAALPGRYGAA
ncbi:MAG: glycosyltransferase [Pseudomonadota bacterium]